MLLEDIMEDIRIHNRDIISFSFPFCRIKVKDTSKPYLHCECGTLVFMEYSAHGTTVSIAIRGISMRGHLSSGKEDGGERVAAVGRTGRGVGCTATPVQSVCTVLPGIVPGPRPARTAASGTRTP